MPDETYGQREARRRDQEFTEFDSNPIAKAQREIDYWWERKLAARARRLREGPGVEDPESGVYDPMARFEREVKGGY